MSIGDPLLEKLAKASLDQSLSFELRLILSVAASTIRELNQEVADLRDAWRDNAEYSDRDSYQGWRE